MEKLQIQVVFELIRGRLRGSMSIIGVERRGIDLLDRSKVPSYYLGAQTDAFCNYNDAKASALVKLNVEIVQKQSRGQEKTSAYLEDS